MDAAPFACGGFAYPPPLLVNILLGRRRAWMLTIELLIAVLALGLTCYAVGYAHGKDSLDKRK